MASQSPTSKQKTVASTEDVVGVDVPRLVRLCRVRESDTGDTLAQFHEWTVSPRCAVGDGSSIYHAKLAILERIHNGEVFYAEPHQVRFCKPNVQMEAPNA